METFVESGTQVGDALFIWNADKDAFAEAKKGYNYLKKLLGE